MAFGSAACCRSRLVVRRLTPSELVCVPPRFQQDLFHQLHRPVVVSTQRATGHRQALPPSRNGGRRAQGVDGLFEFLGSAAGGPLRHHLGNQMGDADPRRVVQQQPAAQANRESDDGHFAVLDAIHVHAVRQGAGPGVRNRQRWRQTERRFHGPVEGARRLRNIPLGRGHELAFAACDDRFLDDLGPHRVGQCQGRFTRRHEAGCNEVPVADVPFIHSDDVVGCDRQQASDVF